MSNFFERFGELGIIRVPNSEYGRNVLLKDINTSLAEYEAPVESIEELIDILDTTGYQKQEPGTLSVIWKTRSSE